VFAREVNESAVIKAALQDVVLVSIDCEKGEGPELAKKYGVSGFPTYHAVNGDGEITDSYIGYDNAESWASFARFTTVDRRTIKAKTAAYAEQPTANLARSLGNSASTTYDFKGAVGYFQKARELDPANAADYTEFILTNMYYGSYGGEFTLDEVEAEVKPAFNAPDADAGDKLQLTEMMLQVAQAAEAPGRAVPYVEEAMAVTVDPRDENRVRSRERIAIVAALLIDKDEEKAVSLKIASMPEGWDESARGLNRFAWWCFENRVNLEEAHTLALMGVELAEDDQGRAQILDTAAEICNALGDCGQAVAYMKRAIELQPDSQGYKEQLTRFEKLLEEQTKG
jgi:tetratricopeptide (TPR) repeat protein